MKRKTPAVIQINETAVIYIHVAMDQGCRDANRMESQDKECTNLCREHGWVVREIFCDAGLSLCAVGGRPAFRRMMQYLRHSRDVNLVFYDYTRFGRKTLPALKAFDVLDKLCVYSIAVTNPEIDCMTAAGRTARRDELSRVEDFSDSLSEKTQERLKAAYEAGRWCGRAPLGYQSVGTKVKGKPNIVPFEPEAGLLVKSFELVRNSHDRPAEILRTMTKMGLRSKSGKNLELTTFVAMLHNPAYIGLMNSKKHGIGEGLHEPIVDKQTFEDVQLILGKKPVAAP